MLISEFILLSTASATTCLPESGIKPKTLECYATCGDGNINFGYNALPETPDDNFSTSCMWGRCIETGGSWSDNLCNCPDNKVFSTCIGCVTTEKQQKIEYLKEIIGRKDWLCPIENPYLIKYYPSKYTTTVDYNFTCNNTKLESMTFGIVTGSEITKIGYIDINNKIVRGETIQDPFSVEYVTIKNLQNYNIDVSENQYFCVGGSIYYIEEGCTFEKLPYRENWSSYCSDELKNDILVFIPTSRDEVINYKNVLFVILAIFIIGVLVSFIRIRTKK